MSSGISCNKKKEHVVVTDYLKLSLSIGSDASCKRQTEFG
jgi:hypothetical protein